MIERRSQLVTFLSLFGSMGTLVCCALPALLVSLGLGAVVAGLASSVPGLIWVSENKLAVFLLAGVMLAGNGLLLWLNRNAPCPVDPKLRQACISGRRFSRNLYFVSVTVYVVGFVFAYVLA